MYEIDAEKMSFSTLNELIRKTAQSDIVIHNCCGQRYIASGMSGKKSLFMEFPAMLLELTWTVQLLPFREMYRTPLEIL